MSNYSSLLENISKFITYKRVHNVGEMETYSRHEDVLSHYVWASGYRKGVEVDRNHAEALLRSTNYDKANLEPIFKQVSRPTHSDSMDIQKILGDTKISEYGSFVDGS